MSGAKAGAKAEAKAEAKAGQKQRQKLEKVRETFTTTDKKNTKIHQNSITNHLDVLFRTVSRGSPAPPGSFQIMFREFWKFLEGSRRSQESMRKHDQV